MKNNSFKELKKSILFNSKVGMEYIKLLEKRIYRVKRWKNEAKDTLTVEVNFLYDI